MRAAPEQLVRYCHPGKLLAATTPLPGLAALDDAAVAPLLGLDPAAYRALAARLGDEARAAADALRDLPGTLPRGPLVALGDSQTDDLGSWAEILGRLVAGGVVNAGVSGDTTCAARARLDRLPPARIAIVMLGTNDARRHGRHAAPMLVSHPETARNLAAIAAALRGRSERVLWITPPPVDEARILADPGLTEADLVWRADDVAQKAELVRAAAPDAIDLWPRAEPHHLAADGLHLSPAGQRSVAEQVLRALRA
jgi:lysophospholipase L1-like esterase